MLPPMPNSENTFFQIRDFREILIQELRSRQKRSSRYSMRAFARDLGVKQPTLHDVLSGRYGLSYKSAIQVAEKMKLSPEESGYFCDLVLSQHSRSGRQKQAALFRLKKLWGKIEYKILDKRNVSLLSEWYYPVLVELVEFKKSQLDEIELSRLVGISQKDVKAALENLVRIGVIAKQGDRYIRRSLFLRGESHTPNSTIRRFHKQILMKAHEKIETQPIKSRKFLSTVFSIDSKRIEEARQRLEQMHDEFYREFQSDDNVDGVYAFGLQFFNILEGDAK